MYHSSFSSLGKTKLTINLKFNWTLVEFFLLQVVIIKEDLEVLNPANHELLSIGDLSKSKQSIL